MIELILTVCALNAPDQCEERRLQIVSQGSLMQCMMQAPPYVAEWSGEHPASRVTPLAMRLPRRRWPENLIDDPDCACVWWRAVGIGRRVRSIRSRGSIAV